MLAAFCLDWFLAAPSVELLDSCHKCELLQIAGHLKLHVLKTLCKSKLKKLVADKLVEAGLIQAPYLPEGSGELR